MAYLYLCCLDEKIGNMKTPYGQARHYSGTAYNLKHRFNEHIAGKGSKMLRYAVKQGRKITIVRTWWIPYQRADLIERGLKEMKRGPDLCPLCNPNQDIVPDFEVLIHMGMEWVSNHLSHYSLPDLQEIQNVVSECIEIDPSDAWEGFIPIPQIETRWDTLTRAEQIALEQRDEMINWRMKMKNQPPKVWFVPPEADENEWDIPY